MSPPRHNDTEKALTVPTQLEPTTGGFNATGARLPPRGQVKTSDSGRPTSASTPMACPDSDRARWSRVKLLPSRRALVVAADCHSRCRCRAHLRSGQIRPVPRARRQGSDPLPRPQLVDGEDRERGPDAGERHEPVRGRAARRRPGPRAGTGRSATGTGGSPTVDSGSAAGCAGEPDQRQDGDRAGGSQEQGRAVPPVRTERASRRGGRRPGRRPPTGASSTVSTARPGTGVDPRRLAEQPVQAEGERQHQRHHRHWRRRARSGSRPPARPGVTPRRRRLSRSPRNDHAEKHVDQRVDEVAEARLQHVVRRDRPDEEVAS